MFKPPKHENLNQKQKLNLGVFVYSFECLSQMSSGACEALHENLKSDAALNCVDTVYIPGVPQKSTLQFHTTCKIFIATKQVSLYSEWISVNSNTSIHLRLCAEISAFEREQALFKSYLKRWLPTVIFV